MTAVFETNVPELGEVKRGKVRDIYDTGDSLLIVSTDRLSAFDVILPDPIPDKGKVLNQISLFWFDKMNELTGIPFKNHIITGNVDEFPESCKKYRDSLEGRSMLVTKAQPLAIECIVRGYISGSGWKSYKKDGTVCGINLPDGLKESDKLPEPLFTPSTKAELGEHDINIDFETAVGLVGREVAEKVRDLSLGLYKAGAAYAEQKGIIIADTKFEFGLINDEVILIDEVLTPDSSRFWPSDVYSPGGAQQSFDKQYVRDYLESISFDKKPPGPKLPKEIIVNTANKYKEAYSKLTGQEL